MHDYFFLDLKRLIVCEADDGWDGFEEGLINIDIRFGIDGVVSEVEKLNDSGFLIGLIEESVAGELFLDKFAGGEF